MRLSLGPRHATAVLLLMFLPATAGCSRATHDATQDATPVPSYCERAIVPKGLQQAVVQAAAGSASPSERRVLRTTAGNLEMVAKNHDAPADTRQLATSTSGFLESLANGAPVSDGQVQAATSTLNEFGKVVDSACTKPA